MKVIKNVIIMPFIAIIMLSGFVYFDQQNDAFSYVCYPEGYCYQDYYEYEMLSSMRSDTTPDPHVYTGWYFDRTRSCDYDTPYTSPGYGPVLTVSESLSHSKDVGCSVTTGLSVGDKLTGELSYASTISTVSGWQKTITTGFNWPAPIDIVIQPGYHFRVEWFQDRKAGWAARDEYVYYTGYVAQFYGQGMYGYCGPYSYTEGNCDYKGSDADGECVLSYYHDDEVVTQVEVCE